MLTKLGEIVCLLIIHGLTNYSSQAVPACPATGSTVNWSDDVTWSSDTHGLGRTGKPIEDDDVTIPSGELMILDEGIPSLGYLVIDGTLQFDDVISNVTVLTISVKKITISSTGRLIVGCESSPYSLGVIFLLRGEKSTTPNEKVIVVEGGLDLHGIEDTIQWTKLTASVSSGRSISVSDSVTWDVGDEIVIAPTGFKPGETETFSIDSFTDSTTIRLNTTVSHNHLEKSNDVISTVTDMINNDQIRSLSTSEVYFPRYDGKGQAVSTGITYKPDFAGETTTLSSGKTFTMAAEVGHLTRTVKVMGELYGNIFDDKFGGRIFVKSTGYARLTNVEFYRTGVEQYPIDFTDPRFSVVFSSISDSSNQPCFVKKSAFHQGFSPAIGVFDTPSVELSDNVIHHTVGSAIITNSSSTTINRNMISLVYWPGAFGRSADSSNYDYNGAIESLGATSLVLTNNAISGTERACFHGEPEMCPNSACGSSTWSNNFCHTSLIGLELHPRDTIGSSFPGSNGWQYNGFTIYKCWDFGIYYNYIYDIKIQNIYLMDNGVSVFTMISEPSLTEHDITSKSVLIDSCLLVGTSTHFDCTDDRQSITDNNYKKSANARSWRRQKTNGAQNAYVQFPAHTGIAWPSFTSQANGAPDDLFIQPTQYNALAGIMEIKNTEFAHFERNKCNKEDAAIATNPKNFDYLHQIFIESATRTDNVDEDNLVYFHYPDKSQTGQSCGSITCDGLRKAILQDRDGTFLGSGSGVIGAAIPKAEYNWDSDIGDSNIADVTHPAGFTYTINELAQYKGIIRQSCTDKTPSSEWQGYYCGNGAKYRILAIESMDNDTEIRSIAPVTFLGWTDAGDGVVDLISGPYYTNSSTSTEHTISTLLAVVALDRNYSIYFNGVPPQIVRYHLLNADSNDVIRIGTYYAMPNHLDVYYNDAYKDPKNDNDGTNNVLDLQFDEPLSQYMPDKVSDSSGTNYLDREWNMTQIVIKGSGKVEVALTPAIVMTFTVATTRANDGSFENDLSTEILNLLQAVEAGVSSLNIRTTNVQNNSASSTTTWWMEVSDEICSTLSTCSSSVTQYTKEQYDAFAVKLFDSYQRNLFSSSLSLTDAAWVAEALPRITTDPTTWSQVTGSSTYTYFRLLRIPTSLAIHQAPVPNVEGKVFTTQPKVHLVTANGDHVSIFGASTSQSWYCLASYRTGTGLYSAVQNLSGTTNISFVDGWANFTDLSLGIFGSEYILDFQVTAPAGTNLNVSTSGLTVLPKPLYAKVSSATSVYQDTAFDMTIEIWDNDTNTKIDDLTWNGNSWSLNMEMASYSTDIYTGSWSGLTSATFNTATGIATLSNLLFDQVGLIFFNINLTSDVTPYNLTLEVGIYIFPIRHLTLDFSYSVTMTMTFDVDYATFGSIKFVAVIYTYLSQQYPDNQISNIVITEGSVLVTFTVSGTSASVDSVLQGTCDNIVNGKSFEYNGETMEMSKSLSVNGETYYGVDCGPPNYTPLKAALIIGIVVGIIVIILVLIFIRWKLMRRPKNKTHQSKDGNTVIKSEYGNAYMVERTIDRQNTFNSLSGLPTETPISSLAKSKTTKSNNIGIQKKPVKNVKKTIKTSQWTKIGHIWDN